VFDALFRAEKDGVYRTLYAYTGGRRDVAEEATAEAFARALHHHEHIRNPVAWIYRTAFRLAQAEIRQERRHRAEVVDLIAADPSPGLGRLSSALRELSPRQRAAIVLRYEADLSVTEIARRMGTSAATVRVHLHRGRNRLRELLSTEEDKHA
jgi:RNA polymerase sigma-70 factor (ECF subfamily)